MSHVRVYSPAKVNLHLEIGARRPDGYHDATSIMHTLTLHDVLTVRRESLQGAGCGLLVSVRCEVHDGVADLDIPSEKNIAHKERTKSRRI